MKRALLLTLISASAAAQQPAAVAPPAGPSLTNLQTNASSVAKKPGGAGALPLRACIYNHIEKLKSEPEIFDHVVSKVRVLQFEIADATLSNRQNADTLVFEFWDPRGAPLLTDKDPTQKRWARYMAYSDGTSTNLGGAIHITLDAQQAKADTTVNDQSICHSPAFEEASRIIDHIASLRRGIPDAGGKRIPVGLPVDASSIIEPSKAIDRNALITTAFDKYLKTESPATAAPAQPPTEPSAAADPGALAATSTPPVEANGSTILAPAFIPDENLPPPPAPVTSVPVTVPPTVAPIAPTVEPPLVVTAPNQPLPATLPPAPAPASPAEVAPALPPETASAPDSIAPALAPAPPASPVGTSPAPITAPAPATAPVLAAKDARAARPPEKITAEIAPALPTDGATIDLPDPGPVPVTPSPGTTETNALLPDTSKLETLPKGRSRKTKVAPAPLPAPEPAKPAEPEHIDPPVLGELAQKANDLYIQASRGQLRADDPVLQPRDGIFNFSRLNEKKGFDLLKELPLLRAQQALLNAGHDPTEVLLAMQSLIDLYSMTPLDKNSATARDEHDRRIAATPYIPEGASVQANVMTVTAPGKKTPAANPPL